MLKHLAVSGRLSSELFFFCFFHFIEMHAPNDPPRQLMERFGTGPYAGVSGTRLKRMIESGEIGAAELPDAIAQLHSLSLAMLSEIDRFLGPALESLRASGELERTLVILTADHGDNFYEKADSYGHNHVYDATARVPLAIRVPGDPPGGRDVDSLVSVVDFARTIYVWTGAEAPVRLAGIDLLDPAALALTPARTVFVQGGFPGGGVSRAIVTEQFKLIDNPNGGRELYDLRHDPRELHDLAADRPAEAADLGERLERAFAAGTEGTMPIAIEDLPPELVNQLRGLGYLE